MLTKKFLSLLLAAGLAFGFSLNAGAVAVVNQDVLKIFNFENEKELEESFELTGYVKFVDDSLKKLPDDCKSNFSVRVLLNCVSGYSDKLTSGQLVSSQERDNVITEVTKVITENENFKKQLDKIINGKTKHESLQCIGKGTSAKEQNADKHVKRQTWGFYHSLSPKNSTDKHAKRHTYGFNW